MTTILLSLFLSAFAATAPTPGEPAPAPAQTQRAKELKDFIQKEKPQFERRESQRKGLVEELDRVNVEQNKIRQRINLITQHQQELKMALENLTLEAGKQKDQEITQKRRLLALLKLVYKIKKEGMIRFLVHGDNLASAASRVRVLLYTLRSHTVVTRGLEEKSTRLIDTEKRVTSTQDEFRQLLTELHEQEELLGRSLEKKEKVLGSLNRKQQGFQVALKEYRQVSAQLASLFQNFESLRENEEQILPSRKSLPLPVEFGRVVKNFGRSVHSKFHTVTYQKGIEIEADHNTPVTAILSGVVEYDGWVKGLGNVVIVHHGGGFYSLSAHLFKSQKPQGAKVAQGDTLGFVGDTGASEKPSLYFEIRENGKAVDPMMYFNPKALTALN